jgi:hypothetical protein
MFKTHTKPQAEIIVLYIQIFAVFDKRREDEMFLTEQIYI